MKRLLGIFLVLGLLTTFSTANAEYSYGYGDSWGGMYASGGAGMYGWGTDMYNLGNYMGYGYGDNSYGYSSPWYGSNWGGSCGSLMYSCSGGYDYANLYGSNYYGSGLNYGYSIDISLSVPIYAYFPSYTQNSCSNTCQHSYYSCGGSCNQCNNNQYITNPWSQYPTYPSYPTTYFPGTWTPNPLNPNPNYPTWPTTPTTPTTPPVLPPWGGCGNYVQCPGPVTPPTTCTNNCGTPIPVTPTPNTYTYQPNTSPTDPIRYQVPRAAH